MRSQYPSAEVPQQWPTLSAEVAGRGRPLVLLHGGVGSRTHWSRNIGQLAARFRVVAFDLPGYGLSPDVPRQLEPEAYVEWVASAVRQVADRDCELVGFSFGGALAAQLAVKLAPMVRRLSLLAPGGFGVPAGRVLPTSRMPPRDAPDAVRRATVAANLGGWMLSKTPEDSDEAVGLQIANIERARFDSRRVSLRETLLGDLPRISSPVQLIWGDQDRLAYPSITGRIKACRTVRPDLSVHIVTGSGHWVQYEQAEQINRLLLDFHTASSCGDGRLGNA